MERLLAACEGVLCVRSPSLCVLGFDGRTDTTLKRSAGPNAEAIAHAGLLPASATAGIDSDDDDEPPKGDEKGKAVEVEEVRSLLRLALLRSNPHAVRRRQQFRLSRSRSTQLPSRSCVRPKASDALAPRMYRP